MAWRFTWPTCAHTLSGTAARSASGCVRLFVQAHEYTRASRVRRLLQQRFAQAFIDSQVDLLASPTTPMPAPLIDQEIVGLPSRADGPPQAEPVGLAILRLTAPANLPALPPPP